MKLPEHLNLKRLTLVLVMSMDYLVVLQICLNVILSSVVSSIFFHRERKENLVVKEVKATEAKR